MVIFVQACVASFNFRKGKTWYSRLSMKCKNNDLGVPECTIISRLPNNLPLCQLWEEGVLRLNTTIWEHYSKLCPQISLLCWELLALSTALTAPLVLLPADEDWQCTSHPIRPDVVRPAEPSRLLAEQTLTSEPASALPI